MAYERTPPLPGLVSTGTAIRLLGCPASTFWLRLHRGDIRYSWIDNHYWIKRSTIDSLIQIQADLTQAATVRAYYDEMVAQAIEKEQQIKHQLRLAEQEMAERPGS